jgi:hypothetical protein
LRLRVYRFYRLDGAGNITGADWIEAVDDEEAHVRAQADPETSSYELWERQRLVARVTPLED